MKVIYELFTSKKKKEAENEQQHMYSDLIQTNIVVFFHINNCKKPHAHRYHLLPLNYIEETGAIVVVIIW